MKQRKPLIAANWKMNPAPDNLDAYHSNINVDVIVFPTHLDISACINVELITGAQCAHPDDTGAHTGDISMNMIKNLGCTHVLCGHSERRQDHKESNAFVAAQVASAIKNNIYPILCVGETEGERKDGKQEIIVKMQIDAVLTVLESDSEITDPNFTIAYEPVWAIGTGNTATPEDAERMHAYIRSLLPDDKKEITRILYGGSMKPENAEELLEQKNIDGGLVGGAALDPGKFAEIVTIASKEIR